MCWGSESDEDRAKKEAKLRQDALDKQAAEDRAEAQRVRAQLQAQFGKYLEQDIGYSPEHLKSLQGGAVDANALAIKQSLANTNAVVTARSGGQPLGGHDIEDLASVHTQGALGKVNSLREISQADADLALKNRFNAAAIINGTGAQAQNSSQFDTNAAQQYFANRLAIMGKPTFFGNLGASAAGAAVGGLFNNKTSGRTPNYLG
jgi:hypothetical protein